ncbi:MAG: DUF5333 domain-containing protein [Pseudomonadota bacterium]
MFKTFSWAASGLTLFALAVSSAAEAKPHLRDNIPINNQLFAAAVGDQIRRNCPSISARVGLVWRKARALERYALEQGYTDDEIEDYLESKPDIRAMEARRDAYLAENGVRRGDAESYCALGQAEISANSPIGELLRSR